MNGKPKARTIVSLVNSIPKIFSKWADYWLKKVVRKMILTCFQDAHRLMTGLQCTFPNGLPPGVHLLSVNTIGMYSNINTKHGIQVLTRWLCDYHDNLPKYMPVDFLIAALCWTEPGRERAYK